MTSAIYGFAGGMFATLGVFALLVTIAFYVLQIIGWWKLFTKAGEAGWKSLIPIYNFYILYKISWGSKYFWYMIAAALLSSIFSAIGGTLCTLLGGLLSIAVLVFTIMQNYKLAKAFGHGGGYAVGLIFIPWLFVMILGFGSDEYQGKDA